MEKVKVLINGVEKIYEKNTTLKTIAEEFQKDYDSDILLGIKNNKLQELSKTIDDDCTLSFVTYKDKAGTQTYRRSCILLMLKAFKDVLEDKNIEKIYVDFTVGKGFYCKIQSDIKISESDISLVEQRMIELVKADIPINKRSIDTFKAVKLFNKYGMTDKEKLFKFRKSSKVNLYRINNFEDYFYGYMVLSTGYLNKFKLYPYKDGVILQMPARKEPDIIPPLSNNEKLFKTLEESSKLLDTLQVNTVGSLNEEIIKGNINNIMLVSEALQEKKIAEIASLIASKPDKKFVMIAGPSSSGKTTFSHRLSIQLMANGLKPHPIAVDNYFIDREKTPIDEDGKHDFECIEAIDIEQFNNDMLSLSKGEEVMLPTYNFITGKREYNGQKLKLGKDDILVMEGIHCLNDELSYKLSKDYKFKIYISALTQLNIDEHNRISTTDGRLIRRMVRDARTRGTSAKDTIARWSSVRRGEEKYIFPYQEDADVMFNSALIYELCILKQFAEPLLFGIPVDEPEYIEAKRLLKFLDYFIGIGTRDVPKNSLLREFVGDGCFKL